MAETETKHETACIMQQPANTVGDALCMRVCARQIQIVVDRAHAARKMDLKTAAKVMEMEKSEVTKMRHVEYLESVIRIKPRGYVGSTDEIVITSAKESERGRGAECAWTSPINDELSA